MKFYAVQHRETRSFWTGRWDGWSKRAADALSFRCQEDAFDAAFAKCAIDTTELDFVPVERFTSAEIAQRNQTIVTNQVDRWLRDR